MAARTGMANLILRLRGLTNAGTADITLATETFWTDNHLQDVLDANVTLLRSEPLTWLPETIGGGSISYQDCKTQWRDLEEWGSGTAVWAIRDGIGTFNGTANYTPNYLNGVVRFGSDQGGSAYYLTARSYDLYRAAADVWLRRQAFYSDWYQFSGDGQAFARHQAFDHAVTMEKTMRAQAGQNRQRGAIQANTFVRTDLNPTVSIK